MSLSLILRLRIENWELKWISIISVCHPSKQSTIPRVFVLQQLVFTGIVVCFLQCLNYLAVRFLPTHFLNVKALQDFLSQFLIVWIYHNIQIYTRIIWKASPEVQLCWLDRLLAHFLPREIWIWVSLSLPINRDHYYPFIKAVFFLLQVRFCTALFFIPYGCIIFGIL